MRERFLTVAGQQYCLCQWGDPIHPPVLAFHGLLQQGASWDKVASSLARDGYFVTAPDLRGHGRSVRIGRGGVHGIVDFLVDAERALAALSPARVLLVGHSLGAIVAALTARLRPERVSGLVLIESPLPPEPSARKPVAVLRAIIDAFIATTAQPTYPGIDQAVRWIQETNPGIDDDIARMLADRTTEPCAAGVRWTWDPSLRNVKGTLFATSRADYLEILSELTSPVLSVYGTRSLAVTDRDKQEQRLALPTGAREVQVEGSHNLYFEASRALAREIDAFARAVLPRPTDRAERSAQSEKGDITP